MTSRTAARPMPRRATLIATALDDTLIVEAAAGTGKTTELVGRIVAHPRRGPGRRRRDRRGHVHREGGRRAEAAAARAARPRADDGAATTPSGGSGSTRRSKRLEEAHVSTIHGFCADLLRERPVEARHRSALRSPHRAGVGAAVRRRVRALAPGAARRSAGGRAARAAAHARSAATTARSTGCARRRGSWRSGATSPAPWTRNPFDREQRDRRRRRRAARVRRADASARRRATIRCSPAPSRCGASATRSRCSRSSAMPAPPTTTAGKPGSSICRAIACSATSGTAAARSTRTACARDSVLTARRASCGRGSISSAWTPTPTSRRCCSASCAAPSTATSS